MNIKPSENPHTIHADIGRQLRKAGWEVNDAKQVSVINSLSGRPGTDAPAFFDYHLFTARAEVVAIIEVNQTCRNRQTGERQAVEYANQIYSTQSFRPFAFQTDGKQIFLWDHEAQMMRPIDEFLSGETMEEMLHQQFTGPFLIQSQENQDNWDEDRQLWHDFKQGNYEAFTRIYRQHVQALFNFGSKITPDRNLVEDAVHDLFVEIWKSRTTLGDVNSIKYYLFKALKRKIIRTLGKKTPNPLTEDYHFEMVFSHEFALITHQINADQERKLANALKTLSDRQREAIFLRFYDGLSYEEIASVMSVSIKTAYNFVYMALTQLRQSLMSPLPVLFLLTSLLS